MSKPKANSLSGSEWLKNSISVWSDLRLTSEERKLKHPAMFPEALARRVIECYTTGDRRRVLDPFSGSGSTLLAAAASGGTAVGAEINPTYLLLSAQRVIARGYMEQVRNFLLDCQHLPSAFRVNDLPPVDLAFTSPPFWNVLGKKRTRDRREEKIDYAPTEGDLCSTPSYADYVLALRDRMLGGVVPVLRPGGFLVMEVMDLRAKDETLGRSRFYPFSFDLIQALTHGTNLHLEDVIIWDRRLDYNNFGPIGFPYRFVVNKAHSYLLVFHKDG